LLTARTELANDRLSILDGGNVRLEFKRPWADGTSSVELEPLALLARPRTATKSLSVSVAAAEARSRSKGGVQPWQGSSQARAGGTSPFAPSNILRVQTDSTDRCIASILLVPRPRAHVIRYHGVFGPAAKDRDKVVPRSGPVEIGRPSEKNEPREIDPTRVAPVYRLPWALLLKRVFLTDVLECRRFTMEANSFAFGRRQSWRPPQLRPAQ